MIQSFTLPLPPSANRYWRIFRNRAVISTAAREYKQDAVKLAKEQGVQIIADVPVSVVLRVYRKIKSGDLDNKIKILLDSLRGVAFTDDKQVVEIHAWRFDDKANPRVDVVVSDELPLVASTP